MTCKHYTETPDYKVVFVMFAEFCAKSIRIYVRSVLTAAQRSSRPNGRACVCAQACVLVCVCVLAYIKYARIQPIELSILSERRETCDVWLCKRDRDWNNKSIGEHIIVRHSFIS